MGNSKSKKQEIEPDTFFEREKWKRRQKNWESKEKPEKGKSKKNKIGSKKENAATKALPVPRPAPSPQRSYDDEAIERMRNQLNTDADAFLLNNILLSIQFFENYERDINQLKRSPISDLDKKINVRMVKHNKHVFIADKIHEYLHDNVRYKREGQESSNVNFDQITAERVYVIYDNIEASEPSDLSDYSSVLDAPFYKMLMENSNDPGYVKLKKVEVLNSININNTDEHDSVIDKSEYTDSEKESDDSESYSIENGRDLLTKLKTKLKDSNVEFAPHKRPSVVENGLIRAQRRPSGPVKSSNYLTSKADLRNLSKIRNKIEPLAEQNDRRRPTKANEEKIEFDKPRKSILKTSRRPSGPLKQCKVILFEERKVKHEALIEEGETSGYNSNSSPQNESSGTESDYGYASITNFNTPKPIEKSAKNDSIASSGVVPDDCWIAVQTKSEIWEKLSDEEDDDKSNTTESYKKLYDTHFYLSSKHFMANFVDQFTSNLGEPLGFTTTNIEQSMTQGASIFCRTNRNGSSTSIQVIPAIIIAWPSMAYEWIIRQRRIIQNPKTNFCYQWPTKYMINKARGLGAILVPVGYQPKQGTNSDQQIQWKVVFPAAERYLETCLAHSQIRCYLFTLTLLKTFMESESSKMGIDVSHIKNHLFWQCEDNYARWPEDRLGETLRIFLRTFYRHLSRSNFPDYFIENINLFKNIPKTVLHRMQRKLADILESPVMHMLSAINNLKYIKKDFYPAFDSIKLYKILTAKNVLHLINPSIPEMSEFNSGEEDNVFKESEITFWDKAKAKDKHYLFKKEKHRQMQAQKKIGFVKKSKEKGSRCSIDKKYILPQKMEHERRKLVLEFFIPHFIAMAGYSEKFGAIKQAIIYIEHAYRLAILLKQEPGSYNADDQISSIRIKLNEYKIKLADHNALKIPKKGEKGQLHNYQRTQFHGQLRSRPEYANLHPLDSPPVGNETISFVDVHQPCTSKCSYEPNVIFLNENSESEEDSKL